MLNYNINYNINDIIMNHNILNKIIKNYNEYNINIINDIDNINKLFYLILKNNLVEMKFYIFIDNFEIFIKYLKNMKNKYSYNIILSDFCLFEKYDNNYTIRSNNINIDISKILGKTIIDYMITYFDNYFNK